MSDAETIEERRVSRKETGSFLANASWSDRRNSFRWLEILVLILVVGIGAITALILIGQDPGSNPIDPIWAAALLIANLIPATAMLVLIGRRLAMRRMLLITGPARQMLHIRLVAIFSLIAAVPALFLVIFASYLFQSGVQFWFSDSARGMIENAGALAEGYYEEKLKDVGDETTTMAGDLRFALERTTADDPAFLDAFLKQVLGRKLSEAAIVSVGPSGEQNTIAVISPEDNTRKNWIDVKTLAELRKGKELYVTVGADGIVATTVMFKGESPTYLFARRSGNVPSFQLGEKAKSVLSDYKDMVSRSKALQFQFNVALYIISLLINAVAVWVALEVADRLVRPVNNLVDAAQRIADGDLTARVEEDVTQLDEIGLLSRSFNSMTQRLQEQTGTLIGANQQLAERGDFIEAVLSSVSSGIVTIDEAGVIDLANSTAEALLSKDGGVLIGHSLRSVAPHFQVLLDEGVQSRVIQIEASPEQQTLAVKISVTDNGAVITFEDISQQLADQRRAAWSDVARRIAHEIKNPLTPIQLAAERLQRRFAKKMDPKSEDVEIFGQLTGTIVRQVDDLRKIADEFSSFARMPKPVMRDENLSDIIAHSVFLFEVSNPEISFSFEDKSGPVSMICDRRQMGQAITNLLKNAVEAIGEHNEARATGKVVARVQRSDIQLCIEICDNGPGLPADRDRIVEPYVTKRKSGSGLGLAIVKKIVTDHHGQLELADNEGGGAVVKMIFETARVDTVLEQIEKEPVGGTVLEDEVN